MKKEFKMKKTLALVMALSVAATSAANFSALALDNLEGDIELTLKPNSASYSLTIPASIDLTENVYFSEGKTYYKAESGGSDVIEVSSAVGVTSVNFKLKESTVKVTDDQQIEIPAVVDKDGNDTKTIDVIISDEENSYYLSLGDSDKGVDFNKSIGGTEQKKIMIKTRNSYTSPVSADLTGALTFTTSASE